MNVALSELPDFTCSAGARARPTITPPASSSRRASPTWSAPFSTRRARLGRRQPIVEVLIRSTLDDSAGADRASTSRACSASTSRRNCPTAQSWDDHRETVADLMIDTVDGYAPNFARRSVLGRQIMSPLDLERTFGLVGGDIFHGALDLEQMFSARPMLGHADYRGPLPGLYMCGCGHASGRRRRRIAGAQRGTGSAEGFEEAVRLDLVIARRVSRRSNPGSGCLGIASPVGWAMTELSLSAAYGRAIGAMVFGGCWRPKSAAAESRPICTMPRRIARVLCEVVEQRVAVAAAHRARQLGEVLAELRQHLQHGVLVVQEHVAPHRGIGRRDAREVAEAARGELQHFGRRDLRELFCGADDGVGDRDAAGGW